jgi:hypothetical protein
VGVNVLVEVDRADLERVVFEPQPERLGGVAARVEMLAADTCVPNPSDSANATTPEMIPATVELVPR